MDPRPPAPLRLLLVTQGKAIPHWLVRCMEEVEQSRAATVVLVLQVLGDDRRRAGNFGQQLRQVLFRLYKHFDRHLFRRCPDALAPISVPSALPNRPIVAWTHPPDAPLARRLQQERVDVVLDPFSLLADGSLAEVARYGVWSTAFGRSGDPRTQAAPGFWEVIDGTPGTETRLCIRGNGFDKTLSLYISVAPTDRRSLSRSQNHIYWKIAAALARKIQLLWEDSEAFRERLKAATPFDVARGPSAAAGNVDVVRACAVLVRRYASDKWRDARYQEQWALAYQLGVDTPLRIETLQTLLPPRDRFWADPFPVRVGNEYYIFHEELLFASGKGSIVVTVLDDTARPVAPCLPVLQKDCHLSYPFVFQWDGDFFMIPETAARHQVELYRCVGFPSHWKLERVLLAGLRAFDSTLAFVSGRWWLFANVAAYGAGSMDELHVFHADSPLGPWTPRRNNPVKSDVRSARPAGRIFERHGQYYRPAQDCSRHYGYAVSINRILQLDPETYAEVEVDKILPNWAPHVVGVHTFNPAGGMTVIDCLVRRKRS